MQEKKKQKNKMFVSTLCHGWNVATTTGIQKKLYHTGMNRTFAWWRKKVKKSKGTRWMCQFSGVCFHSVTFIAADELLRKALVNDYWTWYRVKSFIVLILTNLMKILQPIKEHFNIYAANLINNNS